MNFIYDIDPMMPIDDADEITEFTQQNSETYVNYLGDVYKSVQSIDYHTISQDLLTKHKIKILGADEFQEKQSLLNSNTYVEYLSDQQNGLVCIFQVMIDRFILEVKLLNMHRNSQDESQSIGSGTFGIVKKVDLGNKKFAIKKIQFNKKSQKSFFIPHLMDPEDNSERKEIFKAIKQYCVYKICSMLQIGPQIIFQNNYDIICYNDAVEFYMELCDPSSTVPSKSYAEDLKFCVGLLHRIHFIHKDIKPANILFSPSAQKYVLCDFGTAHAISESLEEKTETYFSGTYQYANEQMKKLFMTQSSGHVNLYFNDLHALQLSLRELRNITEYYAGSYERNSLSILQSQNSGMMESYNEDVFQGNNSNYSDGNRTPQGGSNEAILEFSTSMSANLNFIKYSQQIKFYQMKVIYQFLSAASKTKQNLRKIVVTVIDSGTANQNVCESVYALTQVIVFPHYQYQVYIRKLQNCIRIFGLVSEEVKSFLEQILSNNLVPVARSRQLTNSIHFLQKSTGKILVNNQNIIQSNIARSQFLKNRRVKLKNLWTMWKRLLKDGKWDIQNKKKFVRRSLDIMNDLPVTKEQVNSIFANLQFACLDEKTLYHKSFSKLQKLKIVEEIEAKLWRQNIYQIDDLQRFLKFYTEQQNEETSLDNCYRILGITKRYRKQLAQNRNQNSQTIYDLFVIEINYLCYLELHEQARLVKLELDQSLITSYDTLDSNITSNHKIYQGIPSKQKQIKVIDIIVKLLVRMGDFNAAKKLNNEALQFKKQYFFPQTVGESFAYSYLYEGIIEMESGHYDSAIIYFKKCIDNIQQIMFIKSSHIISCQAFNNLACCYAKMNQYEHVAIYYEKAYTQSISTLSFGYGQSYPIVYLQNLVFTLLKLDKCDKSLYFYIDQLCYLKENILDQIFVNNHTFFKIPIINNERLTSWITNKQTYKFALKSLISSLQPYLPHFIAAHNDYCLYLYEIYLTQNRINQSLKYLWRFFKHSFGPKQQSYYQLVLFYVVNLIKSQSKGRALMFLKNHVKSIPREFDSITAEFYKKICLLSRSLLTKDRKYYNFVWKEKPFANLQNYSFCVNEVQQNYIGPKWEKYLWIKRLKVFRQ